MYIDYAYMHKESVIIFCTENFFGPSPLSDVISHRYSAKKDIRRMDTCVILLQTLQFTESIRNVQLLLVVDNNTAGIYYSNKILKPVLVKEISQGNLG
jgi:hypothetical protein